MFDVGSYKKVSLYYMEKQLIDNSDIQLMESNNLTLDDMLCDKYPMDKAHIVNFIFNKWNHKIGTNHFKV